MAILGNISRNQITNNTTSFDMALNIQCQSSHNITEYELIYDNISLGVNTITPATEYADIININEPTTGYHTVEIVFRNTNAEEHSSSLTVYLDLNPPVINNFSVASIEKDSSGDYLIDFQFILYDESGFHKVSLYCVEDNVTVEKMFSVTTSNHTDNIDTIVSGNFVGTKTYRLTVIDLSGNVTVSADFPLALTNNPPLATRFEIIQIVQNDDFYLIDVEYDLTLQTSQRVEFYSITFQTGVYDFIPYMDAVSPVNIQHQLQVPKTEPAGTKRIFGYVKDNFGNISSQVSITFELDKVNPMGSIVAERIVKVGNNYDVDFLLNGSDSGNIAAYAFALDDINPSNWSLVTPTQNFELPLTRNIGSSGQTTGYARFRDFSGNLSDVYSCPILIDTTNPTVSFELNSIDLRSDSDYDVFFDCMSSDNREITSIKFYAQNLTQGRPVIGHDDDWQSVSSTRFINEIKSLRIPATETEDSLQFYFQVRDFFGNVSTVATYSINFDKTAPVISSFGYYDVEQTNTHFRIYGRLQATDNIGVVAYRAGFDDISSTTWNVVSESTSIDEVIYLDVPKTEVGISKNFIVQVKDKFDNVSSQESFSIEPEDDIPSGSASFSHGTLTADDFVVHVQMDATDATSDVYWYSLVADDVYGVEWTPLTSPAQTISEVHSINIPKTSAGLHDFYIKFADRYKNETPVYHFQYDLDSATLVGGIALERITYDGTNYTANVHLFAYDNTNVTLYRFNGVDYQINPPQRNFDLYLLQNVGSIAGTRNFTVEYEDGFGNVSEQHSISFDLESNNPTATINYNQTENDVNDYFMEFDAVMGDDTELRDYKFWYTGDVEPNWTNLPERKTSYTINETFTVPKYDSTPEFTVRVRDIFDNESSVTLAKLITTVPPFAPVLTFNDLTYSAVGSLLKVDYSVTAAAGSAVSKLKVWVDQYPPNTSLDYFEIDCANQVTATGTFEYLFPASYSIGRFHVIPESDYGYSRTTPQVFSYNFDAQKPTIDSVVHEGSFNDGDDFIVQLRVQATDVLSGIVTIRIIVTSYTVNRIIDYPVELSNSVDQVFNVRLDSTHGANADFVVMAFDLLGNMANGHSLSGVYVDRISPNVTNVVFNGGLTFDSTYEGANTNTATLSFDASDYAEVTHYKFSTINSETFDNTWIDVATPMNNLSVNDTLDLVDLGFTEGLNMLYLHVRDRFNNISVVGKYFEYDVTKPELTIQWLDRIERVTIGSNEYFSIPYNIEFEDNYSGVKTRGVHHVENGNISSEIVNYHNTFPTSYNQDHDYRIILGNYGDTTINVRVTDRFGHVSDTKDFQVFLEDVPPVIADFKVNSDALYTTTDDVFARISASDNVAVTNVKFSMSASETWDSPDWLNLPFGASATINFTYGINLTTLGLSPGLCRVYAYAKDFCQNVSSTYKEITYDPYAPVVNQFTILSVTRTATHFLINLEATVYDTISGLNQYVLSQSAVDTNWQNFTGRPVIGSSSSLTTVTQTELIPVVENGTKSFYFTATDMAGNVSTQATTSIFIDSVSPIVGSLQATNPNSSFYLNLSQSSFSYVVSDNYALKEIRYEVGGNTGVVATFNPQDNITSNSGTFAADFSGLSDGEYTLYLIVTDGFDNTARVPYRFYLDATPPQINTFNVNRIYPSGSGYNVELNVDIEDNIMVRDYSIYDNNVLVGTRVVNEEEITATPTINIVLSGVTETHTLKIIATDPSGNAGELSITETIHDGSLLSVNTFTINSQTTLTTNVSSSHSFVGTASSAVNVVAFCITTNSNVDVDSALWVAATPSTSISVNESITLASIGLTPNASDLIYLHVKDHSGNISSDTVTVTLNIASPTATIVSSPVNLMREGAYYVGTLNASISNATDIVGYALSISDMPSNFKSITPVSSGTLAQSFKVPVGDVDGYGVMNLRLLDVEGDISPQYRFSVKASLFALNRFVVNCPEEVIGNANVIVEFESDTTTVGEFGFMVDDDSIPTFSNITGVTQNPLGDTVFSFNLDVTSINVGYHQLYVWLKNAHGEQTYKMVEFVSEQSSVAPITNVSVVEQKILNGLRCVWVEGYAKDFGIGFNAVSLVESTDATSWETFSTTQEKRFLKKFEYPLSNNSTITYNFQARDSTNLNSVVSSVSVDLSTVY